MKNKSDQDADKTMPLLEAGRYEVIPTNESKQLTTEEKIELWTLIWKVVSELWFMVFISYLTYYMLYLSTCYLDKYSASHSSINPHSLSAASSDVDFTRTLTEWHDLNG